MQKSTTPGMEEVVRRREAKAEEQFFDQFIHRHKKRA